MSDLNVTKNQPLTVEHFEGFFELLPEKDISERSWRVPVEEIQAKDYDLKAVNPNQKEKVDSKTPEELIGLIEGQQSEIAKALEVLRTKGI